MMSKLFVGVTVLACVTAASGAAAQTPDGRAHAWRPAVAAAPLAPAFAPAAGSDPIWEGLLIGGAAGAIGGLIIAPPLFCGHNDPECAAIVRVAIGLPSIAGGMVAGALIDKFSHQRGHFIWTSRSRRRVVQVDPLFLRAGAGVRVEARFR